MAKEAMVLSTTAVHDQMIEMPKFKNRTTLLEAGQFKAGLSLLMQD